MKIVRDKIPQLIEKSSKKATFSVAKKEQLIDLLKAKLHEELNEYLLEGKIEELVDVIEVIVTLAKESGYSEDTLMEIRKQRIEERGKYEKGIVLENLEF